MFRYVCCGAVKLCKIKCNSSISFIMQRSCTAELSVVCTLAKDKSFFGVSANFYWHLGPGKLWGWKFQLGNSKLQHSLECTIVSAKWGSCLVSGLPQISLEANYYYLIVLSVWIRASQKNVCARWGRVKLLSVPDRGDRLFFSVFARFIDIGKEEEVKSHQILQLPEQFHSLPDQAVEIIVCRVKPTDAETNWHPKVSCSSSHSALKTQQSCALHQLAELLIIMHFKL